MQVKVCKRGWCFIYLQISDIHLYNCMFRIYVFVYYVILIMKKRISFFFFSSIWVNIMSKWKKWSFNTFSSGRWPCHTKELHQQKHNLTPTLTEWSRSPGTALEIGRASLQQKITAASSWINGKAFNHRYTTHTVPFTYTHVDEGGWLMSSCLVIHLLVELQSNSIRISLSWMPAKSETNPIRHREQDRERESRNAW